jgi:hypothetical protein
MNAMSADSCDKSNNGLVAETAMAVSTMTALATGGDCTMAAAVAVTARW